MDEFPDAHSGVVPLQFHGELRTVGSNEIKVDDSEASASHSGETWQGSVCSRLHVRPPAILSYRIETTRGFSGDLEVALWYAQHRAESPLVLHDLGLRYGKFPHPVLDASTSFVNAQRPPAQPEALGKADQALAVGQRATIDAPDFVTRVAERKWRAGLELNECLTDEQITAGLQRSMRWATTMILQAEPFTAQLTECVTLLTPGGRLVQLVGYGLQAAAADIAQGTPVARPPVLFLHGVVTASGRCGPRADVGSIVDGRQTFLPPFFAAASRCEDHGDEDASAGVPIDVPRSVWRSWAARGAFIPAFSMFGRTTLVQRLPPLEADVYRAALERGLAIVDQGSFSAEDRANLAALVPDVDVEKLLEAVTKAEQTYSRRSDNAQWWGADATGEFRADLMSTFSLDWTRRRRLVLWRSAARQRLRGH